MKFLLFLKIAQPFCLRFLKSVLDSDLDTVLDSLKDWQCMKRRRLVLNKRPKPCLYVIIKLHRLVNEKKNNVLFSMSPFRLLNFRQ